MISTRPLVKPDGLYSRKDAAAALGINPSTLHRYTEQGVIKAATRKGTGKRVWRGEDILKLWYIIY